MNSVLKEYCLAHLENTNFEWGGNMIETTPQPLFDTGQRVKLHHLIQQPNMNGTNGTITHLPDKNGRYGVCIDGMKTSNAIKIDNLIAAEDCIPSLAPPIINNSNELEQLLLGLRHDLEQQQSSPCIRCETLQRERDELASQLSRTIKEIRAIRSEYSLSCKT